MSTSKAIGRRDGDYIELQNQWAKVYVTYQADGPPATQAHYRVHGEPECSRQHFQSVTAAMAEALRVLALYQVGRAD